MNIVIIGAGSVGMLLASFLAERYHVTLVVRRKEQKDAISANGLIRKNVDGSITKVKVDVETIDTWIPSGFVIVSVKYWQLQKLYANLANQKEETPILFLQNGLAHFEEALKLPQKHIAFGSCQFGAQKENDYTVIHRGIGTLKLAVERGNPSHFQSLKEIEHPLLPVEWVENAEVMLFEKALLNCFINPLTAVLHVKNGELVKNTHTKILLEKIYEELMEAFPEERKRFSFGQVVMLCEKTASNTSSMLQDIKVGKRTEVESIVGAVIRKGKERGKQLPTLETLYYLVLAIEGESK